MRSIVALGDQAVLVVFAETLELAVNLRVHQLVRAIEARRPPWVRDLVPGLVSLAIHLDRGALKPCGAGLTMASRLVDECLAAELPDLDAATKVVDLPVCYDEEFAPDLREVAQRCGMRPAEVVARHVSSAHRVLMVGFVPGHPYIGGLDPKVSVPRRSTPRTRVAAGSIAIANAQTVVYPFASPSGWSVIGRTARRIFDVEARPPTLMEPGDRVRFMPVGRAEFEALLERAPQ